MDAAILAALVLCAAPALAAAPAPAPAPASASAQQPGTPSAADQQPNPGSEDGVTPYAVNDFDEATKADQARMEQDLKETAKRLDRQYDSQKELETRQMKEKFDFLRKQRDERIAFERGEIDAWKAFVVKLRAVEPAERGAEKLTFDQRSMERRQRFDEAARAKNKDFLDGAQRERDQYWAKLQQENNEAARQQQEHATTWGKPSKKP